MRTEGIVVELKKFFRKVFTLTSTDKSWILIVPLIWLATLIIRQVMGLPLSEESLGLKNKFTTYLVIVLLSTIIVMTIKLVSYFFKKDKEEAIKELNNEEKNDN